MPTPPTPPDLPDLNSPTTYNARVLAWFAYIATTLYNWLSSLDASDWFSVQSSPTDATPGRVMTVGAFGLGSLDLLNDQRLVGSVDATDLAAGLYGVVADTPGTKPPGASDFGVLQVIPAVASGQGGTSQITQIYWPTTPDPNMHIRHYRDGFGWSLWLPIVPERGSNPSGSFVRFADGTQICTHFISSSSSEGATWVFPAPFSSSSVALSAVGVFASAARTATFGSISSSSAVLHGWTSAGGRTALTFLVTAIGSWK